MRLTKKELKMIKRLKKEGLQISTIAREIQRSQSAVFYAAVSHGWHTPKKIAKRREETYVIIQPKRSFFRYILLKLHGKI